MIILPRRREIILPKPREQIVADAMIMAGGGWPYVDAMPSNTVLLLPMVGSNGSTTFADQTGRHTVTASNGAALSTAVNPGWAISSGRFDGINDYLAVSGNTNDFAFGTGDFTVEAWVRLAAATGGGIAFDKTFFGGFDTDPDMFFFFNNTNNAPTVWDGSTARSSSIVVSANTWTHVAWSRKTSVLRIFVNGVKGYEGSHTTNFSGSASAYIGGLPVDNRYLNGNISYLRVKKGMGLYTANFTPGIPL